jgi:isoleucyl-tRNA synthetase
VSKEFNVKDSVNLPKTSFKMQANLVQNEPRMIAFWDQLGIYHKVLAKNEGRPAYILHDGPPYANGNIHLGHVLNKVLKDFIVKYKSMKGYFSPYVPGWDCHGLPIEKKMEAELGFAQKHMDILEFRKRCRQYADKYVRIQREQFKRLGVFGDWQRPYLTMDYGYEATIARVFGSFVGQDSVYKGAKPVFWCISCQTALAEAEVEYEEHDSPSVFVKFPARSDFAQVVPELAGRTVSVVIWTTTPWTLPANLAIALHPDYDYVAVEAGSETYIVAEGLLNAFLETCGLARGPVVARFKGAVLEGQYCRHAFIERDSLLVLADYVTLEQGTGCVHTAPGHGQEDYITGQKYGLPILCPVDNEGRFTAEVPDYVGLTVFEANPPIVEMMRERGVLLHADTVRHSYPHCWRCHNPIVFRSTPQWFIALDHNDLRGKALAEIRRAKWYPAWGEERITNMVANRPDWCISRQRSWGVPITVFYCGHCGHTLLSRDLVEHVAGIFEREGADAWYQYPAADLLPPGTTCPECGQAEFEKEFDILDVWFDSGVSYEALVRSRPEHTWPADMYLEGGDQYRGWFHSSLLASLGSRGSSPYREVVTHGWVLDKDGLAMSKSKGNAIEPEDIIPTSGAEILRLWVGSIEYKEDVRMSEEILSRLREAYRKLRNTMRFLLANLHRNEPAPGDRFNFDPARHAVPVAAMLEIDRWALSRLAEVLARCDAAYTGYDFHIVYHTLYQFCAVDLSAVYFDILKDRLYTMGADSPERRSAQTALWHILHTLVRALAPVMPFTTEEVWQHMRTFAELPESVHLADFPAAPAEWDHPGLRARWERLFEVREAVSKALEVARQAGRIGNSLEAAVTLAVHPDDLAILTPATSDLRYIFIVSAVELKEDPAAQPGQPLVTVRNADGAKCERCWNYSPRVGAYEDFPTVCERCVGVVRSIAGADAD